MKSGGQLYFHAPCFDGIVSAVLTWDFAEHALGWAVRRLLPVNYGLRSTWLRQSLREPSAVVDFLYHPKATFWADHHSTTFLTPAARRDYRLRKSQWLVYDESAESCASLLWGHLWKKFRYRNPAYADLVKWAAKTDSAKYSSVEEAIHGTAPALKIHASLFYGDDNEYPAFLVRQLRHKQLATVAGLPRVKERFKRFALDVKRGLKVFKARSRLDGDVVVFDIDAGDTLVPRYAPYYFFPRARYSIGIVRRAGATKITAMRNPWREFASIHIGKLFESFGGGGHQRVGSVVLRDGDADRPDEVFQRLVTRLREGRSPSADRRKRVP